MVSNKERFEELAKQCCELQQYCGEFTELQEVKRAARMLEIAVERLLGKEIEVRAVRRGHSMRLP